jgi:GPH family glycoside/pentoside/hexuronide:cation symporter
MMLILGLFTAVAGCFANLFIGSFMGDICDIDELETGRRREGLFAAVAIFIKKVEFALVGLLSGVLVKLSGFDGALAQQPEAVLDRLRWFTFAPPIVIGALTFALAWRFPINQALMEGVRAALQRRRAGLTNASAAS